MFSTLLAWVVALCAVVAVLPADTVVITHAEYVTEPGQAPATGRILIRAGRIAELGPVIDIPPGAEVIDASGLRVYAGFIDCATPLGVPAAREDEATLQRLADDSPDVREAPHAATLQGHRRGQHPHRLTHEQFAPSEKALSSAHAAGFTAALIVPRSGIFGGRSAVILLGDTPRRRSILDPDFAQHCALQHIRGGGRGTAGRGAAQPTGIRYPSTTMGAVAAWRQMWLDAAWHRDVHDWWTRHPHAARPARDADLEALQPLLDGSGRVVFLARGEQDIHRALDVAGEVGIRPIIAGADYAWRLTARLQDAASGIILGLNWPEKPVRKPKNKPERPGPVLFDEYWESLPYEPKRVSDERQRLWTERVANAHALSKAGIPFTIGSFDQLEPGAAGTPKFPDVLEHLRLAIANGLSEDAALAALTTHAAQLLRRDDLGRIAPGALANLTVMSGPLADKKSKVRWVLVEGKQHFVDSSSRGPRAGRDGKPDKPGDPERDSPDAVKKEDSPENQRRQNNTPDAPPPPEFSSELEADRMPAWPLHGDVLLRNATLLTQAGPDLKDTDLLVLDGRIAEIGRGLKAPQGVPFVDLSGYTVTPGLIDCHSHMALSGGLNESTLSITSEVRCADVVNPRQVATYRALAGGVTTIHTMHGSANTIGGQNVVLKLKYGRPASEWHVPAAAETVKFALGENVKQANSRTRGTRFPNSRMGVEAVMRHAFDAARQYAADWERFKAAKAAGDDPRPVRHDLRLAALADVLSGALWVHCHCYRADEVLRLLAVAEAFGFRIGVLQHILEGYRIIPEMYRHGCAASTFSDWWTYKLEAADAVPHNAARMAQGGVVSTVNSDSGEVVRHLNLEAAKSLRFGALSPRQALDLITTSAARTLGLEDEIGTLEVGKLADIAVFDRHPLDTFSKCVLTLIEGEVYFQHPDFDPGAPRAAPAARAFAQQRAVLQVPPAADGRYVLTGATVHPIQEPARQDVDVLIADGKIAALRPAGGRSAGTVVDCSGLHIYPGLINASTSLGLTEIGSVPGSVDAADIAAFQPELWALAAYNPFSTMIDVTRAEGVTTAMVVPGFTVRGAGRRSYTAGRAGVVQLKGWSMPEALREAEVALALNLPSLPVEFPRKLTREQREDRAKRRREHRAGLLTVQRDWERARRYAEGRQAGLSTEDLPYDRRLEAMMPFVTGEKPVLISANSYKKTLEALQFAERYGIRIILHGGREAWKVADRLAAAHVDVIVVRSMAYPGSDYEPWDSVYRNAAVLADAGVRFCFATGGAALAKQLGVEAGMAVAHGLDPQRAMRAVTLDAAAILGLDKRMGSLKVGKIADVIVTTDTPLQADNHVIAMFIAGEPVQLTSKHTRNDDLFRNRPAPPLQADPELRGPPLMRLE